MFLNIRNFMKRSGRKSASVQALKHPSFRTNPRKSPSHKPRVQASSQSPQAPGSEDQGTSDRTQAPGNKQQG
jgi:hypothetical protein